MPPKLEWSQRWSAQQHGRRLKIQRAKAELEGSDWNIPSHDPNDSSSDDDMTEANKAHESRVLSRWGQSRGISVQIPARNPVEEYQTMHWLHALPSSFAPERHAFMVLGRPLVVPFCAFRQ